MQLGLPLLAYPWLGRKLGPEAFGLLMYMALIPSIINLVMDWGLPLAAARHAAEHKTYTHLKELIGAVFTAKIFLVGASLLGGAICLPLVPHASQWPLAYFLAIGSGIARGLSPLWYYQGTGRQVKWLAIWDVGSTLLILVLMVLFIQHPDDWQIYLLLLALCKGITWLVLDWNLWRRYKAKFNFTAGIKVLKEANLLFLASIFNTAYGSGSQLILGYFLSAADMGVLVAINKMTRALATVAKPLSQTIFPQICSLGLKRKAMARKILLFSLAFTGGGMIIATIIVWWFAPFAIKIALGPNFENAVPILRIVIVAAPLMACNTALGEQFLVAWHWEKQRAYILGSCALTSIGLAVLLPKLFGITGGALLPVIVDALIFFMCIGVIWKKKSHFWD